MQVRLHGRVPSARLYRIELCQIQPVSIKSRSSNLPTLKTHQRRDEIITHSPRARNAYCLQPEGGTLVVEMAHLDLIAAHVLIAWHSAGMPIVCRHQSIEDWGRVGTI